MQKRSRISRRHGAVFAAALRKLVRTLHAAPGARSLLIGAALSAAFIAPAQAGFPPPPPVTPAPPPGISPGLLATLALDFGSSLDAVLNNEIGSLLGGPPGLAPVPPLSQEPLGGLGGSLFSGLPGLAGGNLGGSLGGGLPVLPGLLNVPLLPALPPAPLAELSGLIGPLNGGPSGLTSLGSNLLGALNAGLQGLPPDPWSIGAGLAALATGVPLPALPALDPLLQEIGGNAILLQQFQSALAGLHLALHNLLSTNQLLQGLEAAGMPLSGSAITALSSAAPLNAALGPLQSFGTAEQVLSGLQAMGYDVNGQAALASLATAIGKAQYQLQHNLPYQITWAQTSILSDLQQIRALLQLQQQGASSPPDSQTGMLSPAPQTRVSSAFASIDEPDFPYVMPAMAKATASDDDDAGSLGLAYTATRSAAQKRAAAATAPATAPDWIGWSTGSASGDRMGANAGDLNGSQVNVNGGITHLLSGDMLVGLITGYEHSAYTMSTVNQRVAGDGGTIGAYAGWRIVPTLRADAAIAWSDIDYRDTSAGATGSFFGSRWLADGGLTGTYSLDGLWIWQPSARLLGVWEQQNGYIDSLGTAEPGNSFAVGRVSVGGEVSRPYVVMQGSLAGWLTPSIGLFADYRFSDTAGTPLVAPMISVKDGFTARATGGLSFKTISGPNLTLNGEIGGLGPNQERLWAATARLDVPFWGHGILLR